MKYNIGDVIVWLLPINCPELSTIVKIWRDFDGSILYHTETYRKEEDKILKENFSELELDNILDNKNNAAMAKLYPVRK